MTTEDFGEATYVSGRHHKNPVLVYTCRKEPTKVYEFMIACRYKIPGLVSWKCVACTKVKNGYRQMGKKLTRKVPLILVDNDIIKEDPESPLNGNHFCNGKDAVNAVLDRARIDFVHRHGNEEPNSLQIRQTIHHFARETTATTPILLNPKEKRIVQRQLDAKCLPLLHGYQKRQKRKIEKKSAMTDEEFAEETDMQQNNQSSSSSLYIHHQETIQSPEKDREEPGDVTEALRKRARRTHHPHYQSSQQPVIVRPLPPSTHYYRPSAPLRYLPSYQQQDQTLPNYYESVEVGHEPIYDDGELIPGDQQQVAYDIEL